MLHKITQSVCRGWGGAAGEEGDAEDDEDDDDDDEDEDEDQDEDDDDVDDSSSDGSCQHTCAGLEHDWPHAGSHSGSDEAMQVFATPEADCNIRPAHQTTGYCLSEGGQVHAERLQAPADLNDVNRSSQAMLYPSMTVPVQRPPYAHHAVAFRTRRRFIGGPRLNSFGAQIRCRHADGAQQNHEHKKQQCGLKSRSWSKVPQFVLYTLINVVGCSL